MSMNTPLGNITQTTPINKFKELSKMEFEQYLLGINNITQGDGAKITLRNLIKGIASADAGNLIEIGQDGGLSVKAGAFDLSNGWASAPKITVDWVAKTVKGVDGVFYHKGVVIPALANFLVQGVPTAVGKHYLYYNVLTRQFVWSVGYPTAPAKDVCHIIEIVILSDGNKFAIQTWSFGGTAESVIEYLNATIGMVVLSGGQITNIVTDAPQRRYPVISQTKLGLANFSQTLATTSTGAVYMQAHATAKNILACKGGQTEIVPVDETTKAPMYVNNYSLADLESGKFMNVWLVGLPVAGSSPHATTYLYVTGDTQYDNLANAAVADPVADSSIIAIANQFEKYCTMARFTISYNGMDFSIIDYGRISQTSGSGSSGGDGADIDLSNLSDIGLDKINQSKALETGNVSTDPDVFADIQKYNRSSIKTGIDTIKPDDYKVVGAPTITDDGVVSEFTSASYITGYTLDLPNITEFTIYSRFTTPSNLTVNTFGCVWFLDNSWGFRQNNGPLFNILNSAGTLFGGGANLTADTEYENVYTYNTSTGDYVFKIKKVDDAVYTVTTGNQTGFNISSSQVVRFGTWDVRALGVGSSIDLNAFKIYVDGNLVYQPCLKIPYTQSKTGSKIVNATYRDRVQDMYEQYGYAPYYTLDETNQNFTLPMGEIYGMKAGREDLNLKTNLSLDNLSETGKKVIDGQWVQSVKELSTATALGTYIIDLTDYLPVDDYDYEVYINANAYTPSDQVKTYITAFNGHSIDNLQYFEILLLWGASYKRQNTNTAIVIVNKTRQIDIRHTEHAWNSFTLTAIGYRRLGTNS